MLHWIPRRTENKVQDWKLMCYYSIGDGWYYNVLTVTPLYFIIIIAFLLFESVVGVLLPCLFWWLLACILLLLLLLLFLQLLFCFVCFCGCFLNL